MYSFYFGSLLLPVTPQKLTTKIKGNNKTLTLVNEGDINFLRSPGLTEISFDVVLPMLGQYSFADSFHKQDSVPLHCEPCVALWETSVRHEYESKP